VKKRNLATWNSSSLVTSRLLKLLLKENSLTLPSRLSGTLTPRIGTSDDKDAKQAAKPSQEEAGSANKEWEQTQQLLQNLEKGVKPIEDHLQIFKEKKWLPVPDKEAKKNKEKHKKAFKSIHYRPDQISGSNAWPTQMPVGWHKA